MKIIREISAMVSGLCKQAQAPGFVPEPSYFDGARGMAEDIRPWIGTAGGRAALRHGARQVLRGAVRGFADFVPDTVDSMAGIAGGIYGKVTGSGYYAGKERGYAASGNLTDRIRRITRLAASPVTDGLNRMDRSDISEMRNDPLFSDAADAVVSSNSAIGNLGALAGSLPAFGLASKGLGAVASGASKMMGAGDRAARIAAGIGRAVPGADYYPTAGELAYEGGRTVWNEGKNIYRNYQDVKRGRAAIDELIESMKHADPSSEDYRMLYDRISRANRPSFGELPLPTAHTRRKGGL